jgi:hypothetical protein
MTLEHYPNDDDQRALLEAQQVLAASGVEAAASGYDMTTLASAVYACGWAYRIDRTAGSFQAEILPQQNGATQPLGIKSGWTAEVALAFALAHALLRQAERGGQPPLPVAKIGNPTPAG